LNDLLIILILLLFLIVYQLSRLNGTKKTPIMEIKFIMLIHRNKLEKEFQNVLQLVKITNAPTAINIAFIGTLPTNLAAIGAAIRPPTIRPATSTMGMLFSKMKNVIELTNTTKNSARQTEPIT